MPTVQDDAAAAQNSLGYIYRAAGRDKESEAAYQSALAIWKSLAEKYSNVPGYQQDLALIHNNLGRLYYGIGRVQEAEAAYQSACCHFASGW